jgi:hypothetical protein
LFRSAEQLPAHLYGITYFGDNIQDEWFVVSLLFHLTREVAGLIVRTCDSDGEFLLIEAAEHLPQWANPETCEQRVSLANFSRNRDVSSLANVSMDNSVLMPRISKHESLHTSTFRLEFV